MNAQLAPAIGDGAMGTMLERGREPGQRIEDAALDRPTEVVDLHRRYLDAGAQRLHTYTFLACAREGMARKRLYRAGISCMREAVGEQGGVEPVLTIGPLATSPRELWPDLELALEEDFQHVRCATVTGSSGATAFLAAWDDVIVRGGVDAQAVLTVSLSGAQLAAPPSWLLGLPQLQGVTLGLGCCDGPAGLRPAVERLAGQFGSAVATPSAGLPHREYLEPEPWAEELFAQVEGLCVSSIGGCCGTTPAHIAALAQRFA